MILYYEQGTPATAGVYACRVPRTDCAPGLFADVFLMRSEGKWWHLGSDQRYRGEVTGFLGPLARRDGQPRRPAACCDFHSRPEDIEAHLARWSAEYGMTQAGVPLPPPPEGWALVPFGAEVPAVHREFIEGGGWAFPRQCRSTITPLFARPAGPTRAYARPKP